MGIAHSFPMSPQFRLDSVTTLFQGWIHGGEPKCASSMGAWGRGIAGPLLVCIGPALSCVPSGAVLVACACLLLESKSVPHVSDPGVRPWVLRSSSNTYSQNLRMSGLGGTPEATRAHRSFIYTEGVPQRGKGLVQRHIVICGTHWVSWPPCHSAFPHVTLPP